MSEIKEIWKKIPGYSKYKISNLGRIKNVETKIVKKQTLLNCGYYQCGMHNDNGIRKTIIVHRLAAEIFIDNPNEYKIVNHIDGNKINNCIDNLEWTTHKKNVQHAYDTGLNNPNSGTKNGKSRKVAQYTLDGKLIKIWDTLTEAKDSLGLGSNTIRYTIEGKIK
jgi:hypothetical protein